MRPHIYETDDIVSSLMRVYSKVVQYHMSVGSSWRGMSRSEYDRFRTEDDPYSSTIIHRLGSWSAFIDMLPNDDSAKGAFPLDRITQEALGDLLTSIASECGKNINRITISDYQQYRGTHSEMRIPDWKTYMRGLGYNSWSDMIADVSFHQRKGSVG